MHKPPTAHADHSAAMDAVAQNGVLKSRHKVFDNHDSTLPIQGGPSFRSQAIQLRPFATQQDSSPLSLRSPATVGGPFKAPSVGIETQGLPARAAGALALGSLAPPAALLAFFDMGHPDDPAPCAPHAASSSSTATPKTP